MTSKPAHEQIRICATCGKSSNPGAMKKHEQFCVLQQNLSVENLLTYGNVRDTDSSLCWEWNRDTRSKDYAHTPWGRANRAMYRAVFGDFDESMFICHSCDNPACVNPAHLFLGTQVDNMLDMRTKSRASRARKNPPKGDDHWLRKQPERAADVMKNVRASMTEESLEKISAANTGRIHTELARANMSAGAQKRDKWPALHARHHTKSGKFNQECTICVEESTDK